MSVKFLGDLVYSNGEYEVDGVTKKRYQRAGAVFQDDESEAISIKLDAVPVSPEWSGWFRMFNKRDKDQGSSEIPF